MDVTSKVESWAWHRRWSHGHDIEDGHIDACAFNNLQQKKDFIRI